MMLDAVRRTTDVDAPQPASSGTHRSPSMLNRLTGGTPPSGTMVIVLMLFGVGGTSAGVSSLFGPSAAAISELRRDIDANKAGVTEVKAGVTVVTEAQGELKESMLKELINSQRWTMSEIIKMADNQGKMATKLGLTDLDTRVSPKLPDAQ